MATEKQIAFIKKLLDDKREILVQSLESAKSAGLSTTVAEQNIAFVESLALDESLSDKQASSLIEYLKSHTLRIIRDDLHTVEEWEGDIRVLAPGMQALRFLTIKGRTIGSALIAPEPERHEETTEQPVVTKKRTAGNKKNNERVYVGISFYELDVYSHRPRFEIVYVGLPGDSKEAVEYMATKEAMRWGDGSFSEAVWINDTMEKNLFIVTESAAKRSYKTAYNHWLESDPE
jgi:hypothetical protein